MVNRGKMKNMIMIMDDDKDRLNTMHLWLQNLYFSWESVLFDNAPDTIEWLKHNLNTLVLMSLDHDLGPTRERNGEVFDPGTGRDVVDYLVTQNPVCPVIVHSTNYIARDGMIFALKGSGWKVSYVVPYNDLEWIEGAWSEEIKKWLRKTSFEGLIQ